jgi:hypothetical protein
MKEYKKCNKLYGNNERKLGINRNIYSQYLYILLKISKISKI